MRGVVYRLLSINPSHNFISLRRLKVKSIRQDKYCSIDGCDHKIYYAERQICQMHYFRFMRNGTYEKIKQGKNRTQNQVGYQMIPNSKHPLAMKNGYVYEHRMVFFDSGKFNGKCEVCGINIRVSLISG